jgi:glutathione S-transferase
MAELMFYTAMPSRGAVVRWMLEEVGEPYDTTVLDLKAGEQNQPAYRAVNPHGKVPALKYKGQVTTEVAAICAFLADEFPQARLNIPVGDPRRGPYLTWLFFNPSAIEPAMMDARFPRQEAPPPTAVGYRDLNALLDVVEAALKGKSFLMGDQFTAADVVTGSGLRWGMGFGMIPKRAALVAYVGRLQERDAFKRAQEKDQMKDEAGKRR